MRENVIDGLVAQLRLTNGFEQTNTGTALAYDHRALGLGVDRAAIVLADRSEFQRQVFGKVEATHYLAVELYIRHNNDVVAARRDADTYFGNIVQRILSNPTLGGSAREAMVTEAAVEDEAFKVRSVTFLKETLTVAAVEVLSAAAS